MHPLYFILSRFCVCHSVEEAFLYMVKCFIPSSVHLTGGAKGRDNKRLHKPFGFVLPLQLTVIFVFHSFKENW